MINQMVDGEYGFCYRNVGGAYIFGGQNRCAENRVRNDQIM